MGVTSDRQANSRGFPHAPVVAGLLLNSLLPPFLPRSWQHQKLTCGVFETLLRASRSALSLEPRFRARVRGASCLAGEASAARGTVPHAPHFLISAFTISPRERLGGSRFWRGKGGPGRRRDLSKPREPSPARAHCPVRCGRRCVSGLFT